MTIDRAIQQARAAEAVRERLPLERVVATLFSRTFWSLGSELVCRCWNHGPDTNPSCRISVDKGLFFCDVCQRGGDSFRAIRDALGCSFVEAVSWGRRNCDALDVAVIAGRASRKTGKRTSFERASNDLGHRRTYSYCDERGEVVFEKVRNARKQFFYRRPVSEGRWVWDLAGVRRVLYGLPLLTALPWTLVVEGEKDVEALWDVGLPATTNPEGAGRGKWNQSYTLQLKRAGVTLVFVIPDNDSAGRHHAREVVDSCRAGRISAALLELPGLPHKGDVSDYLSAGHTGRDLLRLVRQLRTAK